LVSLGYLGQVKDLCSMDPAEIVSLRLLHVLSQLPIELVPTNRWNNDKIALPSPNIQTKQNIRNHQTKTHNHPKSKLKVYIVVGFLLISENKVKFL